MCEVAKTRGNNIRLESKFSEQRAALARPPERQRPQEHVGHHQEAGGIRPLGHDRGDAFRYAIRPSPNPVTGYVRAALVGTCWPTAAV